MIFGCLKEQSRSIGEGAEAVQIALLRIHGNGRCLGELLWNTSPASCVVEEKNLLADTSPSPSVSPASICDRFLWIISGCRCAYVCCERDPGE